VITAPRRRKLDVGVNPPRLPTVYPTMDTQRITEEAAHQAHIEGPRSGWTAETLAEAITAAIAQAKANGPHGLRVQWTPAPVARALQRLGHPCEGGVLYAPRKA